MFTLIVKNKEVELPQDARISLNIYNPAFDVELINRIFSLSINANLTARNQKIFGALDRLDLEDRIKELDARLVLGNLVEIHGVITVQKASSFSLTRNNKIEISFQSDAVDFFDRMKEVLWKSILPSIPATQELPEEYNLIPSAFGVGAIYVVEINGIEFSAERTFDQTVHQAIQQLVDDINDVFPDLAEYMNTPLGLVFSFSWIKIDAESLPDIEIQTFEDLQLKYDGSEPTERSENFREFVEDIVSNPREDFAFPMIYNPDFYGDLNRKRIPGDPNLNFRRYTGVINPWYDNTAYVNRPSPQKLTDPEFGELDSLDPVFSHTWIPLLRIKYLFQKSLKAAGYFDKIQGEFWTTNPQFDDNAAGLLLYNNKALDEIDRYEDEFFGDTFELYINRFKTTIDLADHIDYDDAAELWLDFLEYFQGYISVEGDTVSIISTKDQFSQPPDDWTDLIEDEVNIEAEEYYGYNLQYKPDDSDLTEEEFKVPGIKTGKGELEIHTEIGTIGQLRVDVQLEGDEPLTDPENITEATLDLPYIRQRGSSDELGLGKNPTTPRFLVDLGLIQDLEGKLYNLASSDFRNMQGTQLDDWHLMWLGEGGMYETWWEGIPDQLTGREITVKARLSLVKINEILKWKKSAVIIRSTKGQIKAFIKEVQLDISRTSIAPATVVLSIPTTS